MGSNAVLLIHEGSLGTDGSFGEVQDQMVLIGKLHTNIYQLFEDRAKPINPKTTVKFLRTKSQRTDWWLDSADALELGIVDSVL